MTAWHMQQFADPEREAIVALKRAQAVREIVRYYRVIREEIKPDYVWGKRAVDAVTGESISPCFFGEHAGRGVRSWVEREHPTWKETD